MAYYDVSNPAFNSMIRRFEPSDWGHADVFNQTVKQAVENGVALQKATFRLNHPTVLANGWRNKTYTIQDSRIVVSSIVEIFWDSQSKEAVIDSEIDGYTTDGALVITCQTVPDANLLIDTIEVRNEVEDNAI